RICRRRSLASMMRTAEGRCRSLHTAAAATPQPGARGVRRRSGLRPHRISQLFPRSTVLPVVDLGQSGRTVVDAEAGQGPASVRLRDRQDRLGHANGSFGQPAGKAPQARNASANGSTEVAPALRSSLAQIVIVHRETTSSSTSSTDFPATACSISGGTTKASYRSLTRKALLTMM